MLKSFQAPIQHRNNRGTRQRVCAQRCHCKAHEALLGAAQELHHPTTTTSLSDRSAVIARSFPHPQHRATQPSDPPAVAVAPQAPPAAARPWRMRSLPMPQLPQTSDLPNASATAATAAAATAIDDDTSIAAKPNADVGADAGVMHPIRPSRPSEPFSAGMQAAPAANPHRAAASPSSRTAAATMHASASAISPVGTAPKPAVALALAATALVFIPLLLLMHHAELAAHGLTAALAAATGAVAAAVNAAATFGALARRGSGSGSMQRRRGGSGVSGPSAGPSAAWPYGDVAGGVVLPLPVEAALQLAAAAAALFPLLVAGGAAVAAAVGASGGAGAGVAAAAAALAVEAAVPAAAVTTAKSATAAAWLRVALMYVLVLLIPSPSGRRDSSPALAVGYGTAPGKPKEAMVAAMTACVIRVVVVVRHMMLGQVARVFLLWWAWSALPGAAGSWTASVCAVPAVAFWALHSAGAVALY